MPPCAGTGRVQTQHSVAKIEQPRSIILDRSLPDLAGLEIRFDFRAAGNRNFLASQAVQTVLVEVCRVKSAAAGNIRAIDLILERTEGKVQQHIELEGQPITFRWLEAGETPEQNNEPAN
jgi:hypothetical protein